MVINQPVKIVHREAPVPNTYDWASRGACRTSDPDSLFVPGAAQNRAKTICMGCPVRTECLADALDNRVEFGVWGGMTERERRALLRRRPNIQSWRGLLETARDEHTRVIAIAGSREQSASRRAAQAQAPARSAHTPKDARLRA